MIIHSYATDGYFPWLEFFLKSFKYFNGEDLKVVFTTRNLNDKQIEKLYSMYKNLVIDNEELNFQKIAERASITVEQLKQMKDHIEAKCISNNTLKWKQFASVEDRYRNSIFDTINKHGEDFVLHFDADTYIREPLTEIFDFVSNHDISIKFRWKSKLNRKVVGGLIGFKVGTTNAFFKCWRKHIDAIPLHSKPRGYGQTTFWLAYQEMKDKYKWGDMPMHFISPRKRDNDIMWSGNGNAGKEKILKACKNEFKKRRKNVPRTV